MGKEAAQDVGLLEEVERLEGLLQMVLGHVGECLDLAFNGLAGVVMVSVIDDAGLEFARAVLVDDVIDDGGEWFAGPEYADLLGG